MDAFEVASTFRQFDEVLQLSTTDEGRPLLERLRKAAERFRTGGLTQPDAGGARRAMLVRVSNPDWQPTNIPDLEVRTQFGTVLSILGSDATVRALLKDTVVLGIEESRPVIDYECADSLPFINAIPPYQDLEGHDYSENGDHAMVAIIDDGIDVLHEAFLDDKNKQQSPHRRYLGSAGRRRPAACRLHVWQVLQSRAILPGSLPRRPFRPRSAGTKTDMGPTSRASRLVVAPAKFAGGVAPAAKLLVVISSSDQPTGYSDAHIAALKFIDQVAKDLEMPVVVNISQGMNAGAHDGRSALELGFEHFSDGGRMPGRVVVKSAGNERDRDGHAEVSLLSGAVEILDWQCEPAPFTRPRFRAVVAIGQQIQLPAVGATAVGAVENSRQRERRRGEPRQWSIEPIPKSKGSSRARVPTE